MQDMQAGEPRREWEDTWNDLTAEAKDLECECSEELARLAEFVDLTDDTNDNPMGNPIGLWGWMDECLWGGLTQLRSEVHLMRSLRGAERTESTASGIKGRIEEFQAQQQHLAAALNVAATELESTLDPFFTCCSGWIMEPAFDWEPPDALRSPAWSGVRGGDGGKYASGRTAATMAGASPLDSSKAALMQEMSNDSVMNEVRKGLSTLEEEAKRAGGPTGGWGEVDHEIFQRVFRVFRRKSSQLVCDRVAERMPHISLDEIEGHVQWFTEHEQRQSAKRHLLAKWRERTADLETEATRVQEIRAFEEKRRREGLKRSRSAGQRQLLWEWRVARAETRKQALALQRDAEHKKAQLEKQRSRRQQKEKESQRKIAHEFRQQRTAAIDAERASAEQSCPWLQRPSPEVKRRIVARNFELLRKCEQAGQTLLRTQSQPVMNIPKNPAYQHVQGNPYAPTAAMRHRSLTRKSKGHAPVEPEPEAASASCLREARMHKASWKGSWRASDGSSSTPLQDNELCRPAWEPPCTFVEVD